MCMVEKQPSYPTCTHTFIRTQPAHHSCLQVQKSAKHYTEAARDEILLLAQISQGDPENCKDCVRLLDSFDHSGPNGRHVCMVFDVSAYAYVLWF